jgi:RimJ/RimL family protein N-acetyltransferase
MTDIYEMETARLRLRQWHHADREPFAAMNADGRVMHYFTVPLSREGSDAMIDRCQRLIEQRGWGLWAVELRELETFIGFVGLHIPMPELPPSPCVEVGWRLAHQHWGRGYASEAAAEALRFGFETLALHAQALHDGDRASVLQRDAQTFEHPSVPVGSSLREHCLYRMTSQRWRAWACQQAQIQCGFHSKGTDR